MTTSVKAKAKRHTSRRTVRTNAMVKFNSDSRRKVFSSLEMKRRTSFVLSKIVLNDECPSVCLSVPLSSGPSVRRSDGYEGTKWIERPASRSRRDPTARVALASIR